MRGKGTRLVCLFAVVLAAGCSSAETKGQVAGKKAAATPATLAANQVILGERIEFAGTDGKPVVPLPGVYRVEANGQDKLHVFFGKARKPFVLEARKLTLALKKEQQGRLKAPRAVLYRKEKSPARALLLFLPDGTVYESPGSLEGERARSVLVPDEIVRGASRQVYVVARPWITIKAPALNEVYWNRRVPLQVRYDSGGISNRPFVTLVHRVTNRTVAFALGGTDLTGLYHIDPGLYDVFVRDRYTGVYDTVPIRVAGRIRSIAGGRDHTLVLGPDTAQGPYQDYVWAWGANWRGQCATAVSDLRVLLTKSTGIRGVALAAGPAHSLMIARNGGVLVWGTNDLGQLGLGDTSARHRPVALKSPLSSGVVAIAAGVGFSLALTEDGNVYAWGLNTVGQCGQGDTETEHEDRYLSPVQVKQYDGKYLTNVAAIAAGAYFALALKATEPPTIWAWGIKVVGQDEDRSSDNQLRHAARVHEDWAVEAQVRSIEAGLHTAFAVVEQGGSLLTFAWGLDTQLVSPSIPYNRMVSPMQVPDSLDSPILGTGWYHLLHTGYGDSAKQIAMRGSNDYGQLGVWGESIHANTRLMTVDVIGAVGGFRHSVALGWEVPEAGDSPRPVLLTWGNNAYWQTGLHVSPPPKNPPSEPNLIQFP